MEEAEDNDNRLIIKIIVVGDMGTGKTSLIRRFVDGSFSEFYRITIGVDFANKTIMIGDKKVEIQLWDIAGQERFGSMTGVYYRESYGSLVVFDVIRSSTFEMTKIWKDDIDSKVLTSEGSPIPTVLVANKIDLAPERWEEKKKSLLEYVKEKNFLTMFETSAKDGTNLDSCITYLAEYIVNNRIEPESSKELTRGCELTETSRMPKSSGCC